MTHTFPRNPRILLSPESGLNAPKVEVGGACAVGGRTIIVTFAFKNYLPQLMPGKLSSYITDKTWKPVSPVLHSIIDGYNVQVLNYSYSNDTQLETGYIKYWFCYNNPPAVYFYLNIYDSEGNSSNRMRCSSPNMTTFSCVP